MAMRDLVTGGAACAVPGSSSSSNPFGGLANAILGSANKAKDLSGLPTTAVTVPDAASQLRPENPLTTVPGSEYDNQQYQQPDALSSEFLRGFRGADHGGLADVWDDMHRPPVIARQVVPHAQGRQNEAQFSEFEQIYDQSPGSLQQTWDGPPQRVLSNFLHSFVDSGRAGVPFRPATLPVLGLSEGDKQCIRDRSCIMARHIFADKSEEYINAQVNALLHSLDIDSDHRIRGPLRGPLPELEEYWNESQGALKSVVPYSGNSWVAEFNQQREDGDPESWAYSFEKLHGANGWASEFEQSQMAAVGTMRGENMTNIAAMEQTRMLAHTLSQNADPKFQNSKFLQFVSKMSQGELIVDDNQIKPATASLSGDWAEDYQAQYNVNPGSWADQFLHGELLQGPEKWVNEFTSNHQHGVDDQWVSEFSKLHVQDWGEEFGQQFSAGAFGENSIDNWADDYNKYLDEQFVTSKQHSSTSRGVYVFSDMNPYVGHPNPLRVGQELFRKGLLSEAVLALEAEVLKNPDNAEGWRLLGITHAENDDDHQCYSHTLDPVVGPDFWEETSEPPPLPPNVKKAARRPKKRRNATNDIPKNPTKMPRRNAAHCKYCKSRGHNERTCEAKAIASMMRALDADPTNLEVLLALGVSHTNELEQAEALKYLYRWLQNHPKYGALANQELAESLYYADVARSFNEASQISPEDADVHIVLGVLYNLSREYDKAIESFQAALKLKPRDYSLWNKLGATQANSVQSADAISAYQQALDLKPNYVRAWANMGISYANQGLYGESIRYYVRALAMNPKADNAWQYLKISLSCASRHDMFEACDSRNLDILQKEFPL